MPTLEGGLGQTTTATTLVRAEIEGRGRALVASKALRAGEVILRDSPILLYSALPLKNPPSPLPQHNVYCSNCFKILERSSPSAVLCPLCSVRRGGEHDVVLFCGPNCQSVAFNSSHSPWVCQALTRLRDCPSLLPHQELLIQARFLVAAYNLAIVSPSDFRTLLCLQGESTSQPDDATIFLHSLISSLSPPSPLPPHSFSISLELTSALLAKDKLNAFGLMEPFSEDGDGERSVRAYGIYPNASLFNHDCLPNACRFDYLDADNAVVAKSNADIVVRVIHDVPQGREICLSYFPVNLNYSDRQQRLKEDYGFICMCDRCNVEANWSEDEEEEDNQERYKGEEAMDEDDEDDELMVEENLETENSGVKEDGNFPHAYFFLRYMCGRKNCWGTLAPVPPSNGTSSSVMECNVCGNMKNDEAAMDGDSSSR